ncbi:toprim domain-containing protein [Marinobacter caseinilyticus]|uniref:toprim domain-containing protein n=1 Tax=Marinobacter caseinilyticus TaxID=2692195 RepID=UPI003D05D9CC
MRVAIQNSRIDDRQQCDSQVVKTEGARPQVDIVSEIRRIATCALQFSEVLLKEWLPDGRLKGREYWPTNPTRGDRTPGSFSINTETGQWCDFASQDGGRDLVGLLAYLQGVQQSIAAQMIAHRLGIPGLQGGSHSRTWCAPKAEIRALELKCEGARRRRYLEAEARRVRNQAAHRARFCWRQTVTASADHAYLRAKNVKPHGVRQIGEVLVVPMYKNGTLVNLQKIWPDGTKRFLAGGTVKGSFATIGAIHEAGHVFLVEGWSTGATIHEISGHPVVVAMNCGNLLPVARVLRSRLAPNVGVVLAADNDRFTLKNPGLTAACEVARTLDVRLVWPEFPCKGCRCTDFNDLAACLRVGAVL